jgi:DNA-binding NtrC family response regulator
MSDRILVIDDEESIRFTFERFLSTEGHIALHSFIIRRIPFQVIGC